MCLYKILLFHVPERTEIVTAQGLGAKRQQLIACFLGGRIQIRKKYFLLRIQNTLFDSSIASIAYTHSFYTSVSIQVSIILTMKRLDD